MRRDIALLNGKSALIRDFLNYYTTLDAIIPVFVLLHSILFPYFTFVVFWLIISLFAVYICPVPVINLLTVVSAR